MSSLKGGHTYSVDEKGRVSLPAKLRKYVSPEANEIWVIARGFEQSIYVYPVDEWNKLEQKLRGLSNYDPDHRRFLRTLLDQIHECQLDAQSRIQIPQELREFAAIKDEARIVGTLDKIELWNPKIWEEYKRSETETYESIANKVMR